MVDVCMYVCRVANTCVDLARSVRSGDRDACVRVVQMSTKSCHEESVCSSSLLPVTGGTRANERRTCGCRMAEGIGVCRES